MLCIKDQSLIPGVIKYLKTHSKTFSILSLVQEKFAEHNVLDSILALLCLINAIQLDRLNQQVAASAAGQVEQTDDLATEAEFAVSMTHVVASTSENVSTMAEEGVYIHIQGFC